MVAAEWDLAVVEGAHVRGEGGDAGVVVVHF